MSGRLSVRGGSRTDAWLVPLSVALLVGVAVLSMMLGPRPVSFAEVIDGLFSPTGTEADLIVQQVRVPRTLIGFAAGAALAVAGVVMQTVTRNPLAEPGILGVNAGASLAAAIAIVLLKVTSYGLTMVFAFAGAAAASLIVAVLGGVGSRASIGRLALAGVAVAAVLSGAGSAISLLDPHGYSAMRLWEAGSLSGRTPAMALTTVAVVAGGLLLVVFVARGLSMLALGEESARALGARTGLVQLGAFAVIAILCGAATAAAGPIAFVGLLVPHALRAVIGPDTRRLLLYSALLGPVLLLTADILGGVVLAPRTIPVGVVTAFLGAPLLVALVLSRRVQTEGAPA